MAGPLICLTLTGKTLKEDAELAKKYSYCVDVVELRVDYLNEDEQLEVRKFPSMVSMPCLLTIRRVNDGGLFNSSEYSRTALFARALAFADRNPEKNFAYVDFEDDFYIPSLQDAALAFGVKIIRSCHCFDGPVSGFRERFINMKKSNYEIPKIAFMPKSLRDVTNLFKECSEISDMDHIVVAMGDLGVPSRILSYKLNSYLTYVSPKECLGNTGGIGHIDPVTLTDLYNFKNLSDKTKICAVTGFPLKVTSSPLIHNAGYRAKNLDRVFIPLCSTSMSESMEFAEQVGISGMAVTVPYKADVIALAEKIDEEVAAIGACNTIVKEAEGWHGHNTDASGFSSALCEFIGDKKLHRRKVAIIGAGGASHAVAYAIKALGGKACIFNRTVSAAKALAERFGFDYAPLTEESLGKLEKYSDIIIQTTKVGMNSDGVSTKETNPIWFYRFKGTEYLMDIVYDPEVTPVMSVAKSAGCKVCNGFNMLKYQGYRQFKYFTGVDYEGTESE